MKLNCKRLSLILAVCAYTTIFAAQDRHIPADLSCDTQIDETVVTTMQQVDTGHLVINTKFNNLLAKTVIDTGAIGVGGVINSQSLESMDYDPDSLTSIRVQGAHSNREMKRLKIDTTSVGQASVKDLDYVVSNRVVLPDDDVGSLIGSRYLCNFIVDFDLRTGKFSLHPQNTDLGSFQDDGMHWSRTPFENIKGSGAIALDIILEGKAVKALLDTGARYSLMNWSAAKELGISQQSERIRIEENSARGLHSKGDQFVYITEVSSVGINAPKSQKRDMVMRITDLPPLKMLFGDIPAVNLGVDFLKGRRLIIDYANGQILMGETLTDSRINH